MTKRDINGTNGTQRQTLNEAGDSIHGKGGFPYSIRIADYDLKANGQVRE